MIYCSKRTQLTERKLQRVIRHNRLFQGMRSNQNNENKRPKTLVSEIMGAVVKRHRMYHPYAVYVHACEQISTL